MDRLQVTTLEGQDISAPLLAATYEATAGRELLVQVYLSGLAGGGTYRACLVKELIGGGAYQSPTAAAAVALGVSTVYLATTAVPVQAGDTVKVYVQGLAGDTAAGVVVEVFDAAGIAAGEVRAQVDAGLAAYAPAQAGDAMALTEAERTALDTKFGADGKTLAQAVAVLLAVIAGTFTRTENEDGSITIVFRNLLDTVNRVTGKVDEEANRSAVTIIDGEGAD